MSGGHKYNHMKYDAVGRVVEQVVAADAATAMRHFGRTDQSSEDFVALVWARCGQRDVFAVVEKRAKEIYDKCAEERARGHRRFHESLV
jgi:hypothetical protein